jgi:hypothetical protein
MIREACLLLRAVLHGVGILVAPAGVVPWLKPDERRAQEGCVYLAVAGDAVGPVFGVPWRPRTRNERQVRPVARLSYKLRTLFKLGCARSKCAFELDTVRPQRSRLAHCRGDRLNRCRG